MDIDVLKGEDHPGLLADTFMSTWHPVGQLRKIAAFIVSNATYSKGSVRAHSSFVRVVKTAARTSSVRKELQVAVAPFNPLSDPNSKGRAPLIVEVDHTIKSPSLLANHVVQAFQCLQRP